MSSATFNLLHNFWLLLGTYFAYVDIDGCTFNVLGDVVVYTILDREKEWIIDSFGWIDEAFNMA